MKLDVDEAFGNALAMWIHRSEDGQFHVTVLENRGMDSTAHTASGTDFGPYLAETIKSAWQNLEEMDY